MTDPSTSESWQQRAGRLSHEAIAQGDPTAWFERLYAAGAAGEVPTPWDRSEPNPVLRDWAEPDRLPALSGRRAVVVGCGLGADAEYLAEHGLSVIAFDIAPTAIATARARSTHPEVRYEVGDLLSLRKEWLGAFELVVEIYTVQALPDPPRDAAIIAVTRLVAPGGVVLVIVGARPGDQPADDGPPFPLTRAQLDAFEGPATGLRSDHVEFLEAGSSPWPHWRATYHAGC